MTSVEKDAWLGFKSIVNGFLGNKKHLQFRNIVQNMLNSYENLRCDIKIKVYFLNSHLDYFPQNLGSVTCFRSFSKVVPYCNICQFCFVLKKCQGEILYSRNCGARGKKM